MDHSPPPFFKRGPAPLVRLFFFASLSLALLVVDGKFRYAEGMRSWFALAAYPLQRAATFPIELAERVGGYFSTQSRLIDENAELRAKALAYSRDAQRFQAAQAEADDLRRSIEASDRLDVRTLPHVQRHEIIFGRLDALAPGQALVILNDHDPKPLRYQASAMWPDRFEWSYLEAGPVEWRVAITRVG